MCRSIVQSKTVCIGLAFFTWLVLNAANLRAEEGTKKWVFPAEGSVGSITSSPAIGQDGTVYVGSEDGHVYAVAPDGKQAWAFTAGNKATSSPVVHYYSGIVSIFVGSTNGNLYAIDSSGSKLWEFKTGGSVSSSPAVSNLGTIYVGSEDNKLYAVKSVDGKSEGGEWPFATEGKITSSPAIDSAGVIYVGSHDYKLYAIQSTGKKKWAFETEGVISASPAIYEGADPKIVCVGSEDGKVYAVNMDDGSKEWEFDIGSPVLCSVAVDTNRVYVGADDAKFYAISLTGGSQSWVFLDADGPFRSSPLIGSDGTLYVGSDDYRLYAIKSSDGALKWSFPTGGEISSSPAIGFGGDVYVGSQEGKLYALESSSPRLGNVPWPRFGHDARNTARNVANKAPTSNAGPDQTVKSNDAVTLDGTNSFDPDYGVPLYSWSQTEGTSVALSDKTAVKPTFKAPDVDEETALTFELTVTDNGGKTAKDAITVTVQKKDDDDSGCFISTAGSSLKKAQTHTPEIIK